MNQVIQPVSVTKLHNPVKVGRDHTRWKGDSSGDSSMLLSI